MLSSLSHCCIRRPSRLKSHLAPAFGLESVKDLTDLLDTVQRVGTMDQT